MPAPLRWSGIHDSPFVTAFEPLVTTQPFDTDAHCQLATGLYIRLNLGRRCAGYYWKRYKARALACGLVPILTNAALLRVVREADLMRGNEVRKRDRVKFPLPHPANEVIMHNSV